MDIYVIHFTFISSTPLVPNLLSTSHNKWQIRSLASTEIFGSSGNFKHVFQLIIWYKKEAWYILQKTRDIFEIVKIMISASVKRLYLTLLHQLCVNGYELWLKILKILTIPMEISFEKNQQKNFILQNFSYFANSCIVKKFEQSQTDKYYNTLRHVILGSSEQKGG